MRFNGLKMIPNISDQVATKTHVVVAGTLTTTYVAVAPVGTALAASSWSVRRIRYDSATEITLIDWADDGGDLGPTAKFVHVATDLTALTYG